MARRGTLRSIVAHRGSLRSTVAHRCRLRSLVAHRGSLRSIVLYRDGLRSRPTEACLKSVAAHTETVNHVPTEHVTNKLMGFHF